MAIVFLEHITGKALNAFNNNVVRFTSSTVGKQIVHAELTITRLTDSYVFQITPSPEGEFYFNMKSAIKKIINLGRFADPCTYGTVGELEVDSEAYALVQVEYKIVFDDLSEEVSAFTYDFLKAVQQITEKAQFAARTINFPLHQYQDSTLRKTVFKGYPFDISTYGDNMEFTPGDALTFAEFLAADLPALSLEADLSVEPMRVNRYIINDGELTILSYDYQQVNVTGYTAKFKQVDKCGVYFKWHNNQGGWDYWLFNSKTLQELKDSLVGTLNDDFENLPNSGSPVISMGKTLDKTVMLGSNDIYEFDRYVFGIISSPKVYMYLGDKGQKHNPDNWIEVLVKGKSVAQNSQSVKSRLEIEVTVPYIQTLTL